MKRVVKGILWLLFAVFIAFAAVQYNDPDPWVWISVYGLMALFALTVIFRPLPWFFYLLAASICLIWTWFQWPKQWEGIGDAMLTENTEHARESLGLLICFAACIYYYFAAKWLHRKTN